MIIAELSDQLANQMFGYASMRCIAMERGAEFAFYRKPLKKKYVNDNDEKYGRELHTIFPALAAQRVEQIPEGLPNYDEPPRSEQDAPDYRERVIENVPDSCLARGHYVTTCFIKPYLKEMREWFTLPADVVQRAKDALAPLRASGRPVVSVHFRVGKDYLKLGYRMKENYWFDAADHMREKLGDPIFVCVYDQKTAGVRHFMNRYDTVDFHGSLVYDMAVISNCDANIVCNSSFSIMAALLNAESRLTVCPQHYFIGEGCMSESAFLPEWTRVGKGERDQLSVVLWKLRKIAIFVKKQILRR